MGISGIQTACYLYNRSLHSAVNFVTPFEKYFEKIPDISNIWIFGARTIVFNETVPKGKKLEPRCKIMYLTGFTSTGYELFEPSTQKTVNSCNVIIQEFKLYRHDYPNEKHEMFRLLDDSTTESNPQPDDQNLVTVENSNTSQNMIHSKNLNTRELCVRLPRLNISKNVELSLDNLSENCENSLDNHVDTNSSDDVEETNHDIHCNKLSINIPGIEEFGSFNKLSEIKTFVPITFKDAMSNVNATTWKGPIEDELKAITENNVWTIVERKPEMKLIPLKWIFAIRSDDKPKARLVAVGCKDHEQYTNTEKAAPTPSISVIRWFLIVAVRKMWNVAQIDFKSAFLNGYIDREKFVAVPEGINVDRRKYVCKLNKALYGLALAPRCWNETLNEFLVKSGFTRSEREPCIYTRKEENSFVMIIVYVDDCLITGTSDAVINKTIEAIESRFKIKNLGFPEKFLGIQISRKTNGDLVLHQTDAVNKVLKNYRMEEANAQSTPMIPLGNHKSDNKKTDFTYSYKQVIGELLYLANTTRLDISFAVNYAARAQANPQDIHFTLVKRILRYLKGNPDDGLHINPDSDVISCYVDADYGGDQKTRRSTTGFIVKIYGSIAAYASHLQPCIAESTGESEFIAICEAAREVLFLARLTEETLEPVAYPIKVYEDNVAALRKCENTVSKGRLKHLELKYLKVREHFREGLLTPEKIEGTKQLADILTKPLLKEPFINLRDQLMVKISNV
jgi:hypothetical protein